ncbi:MAG: hypothetical protein AAB571_05670 [Chloroflexota bacterium]
MSDGQKIATRASTEIEAWLREWDGTVSVENVEYEAAYQEKDIDLLWMTATRDYSIEIKADRNDGTGNFFFETISNKEKNTLGCFLKTQADFLFYYFVEPRTLYILPMPRTRKWFAENINRFEEREAATPVGKDHYITVGRIVPIDIVLKEVSGVKVKQL